MSGLRINNQIMIDEGELEESFIRSSGPGGQNVNKVASAVQLRFCVTHSANLPEWVKQALRASAPLTRQGALVITAQRFREREKNRADARARLAEILRRAATPKRKRAKTRIPQSSKQQRLENKRLRARTKKQRSNPAREL